MCLTGTRYLCNARPSRPRVERRLPEREAVGKRRRNRALNIGDGDPSALGPVTILRDEFSRSLNGSIWPEPYLKIEIATELV